MKRLLFLLTLPLCLVGYGFEYDYEEKYTDEEYIFLQKNIDIIISVDEVSGKLTAKSIHDITIRSLTDNCNYLNLIQVPYYKTFQQLNLSSAKYYNIDSLGNKRLLENVKVKYAENKDYYIENIFYGDLKVKQFAPRLPVTNRTLLKYKYEIIYNDLKFLTRIMIQDENQTVEKSVITLKYDKKINVDTKKFNIPENKLRYSKTEQENFYIETFEFSDLHKYKLNDYSPSLTYFIPHLLIMVKNYETDSEKISLLEDTGDLYRWYHSLIGQLNPDRAIIEKLLNKILNTPVEDEEKIRIIFDWVKTNIQYLAFEDGIAGFKPEEAHIVLENGYADCKGFANLLVNLLNASGFKASHAWVGTRNINYDYSTPSLVVDNHMICALNYKDSVYFLDATNKTGEWNKIPSHLQGKEVLVSEGTDFSITKVPEIDYSSNTTTITGKCVFVNNERELNLEGKIIFRGSKASEIRSYYLYGSKGTKRNIPNIVSRYIINGFHQKDSSGLLLTESDNIQISLKGNFFGQHIKNENKILLFCNIDNKLPISFDEDIQTPLNFDNKESFIYQVSYVLPENRNVIIPENIHYSSPNGKFSYDIEYKLANRTLTFTKKIKINTLTLKLSELDAWKELLRINARHSEKFVTINIL